jgi:hypothetical protein
MNGTLIRLLVVGVPGLCFVIAGVLNADYPAAALGGFLVIDLVYGLSRKRGDMVGNIDVKRQRRAFALAGVIGASFAITGFAGHGYLVAAAGTVIFIGSLLRLYAKAFTKNSNHIDASRP